MIGLWQASSTIYLYVLQLGRCCSLVGRFCCGPEMGKSLGWQILDHTHLTVYSSRCLGGVICAMGIFAFVAAGSMVTQRFFFQLVMANFSAMIVIHMYSAVKKIQSISETYEIV